MPLEDAIAEVYRRIEAHADNIILLHRDEEEMEGQIELIIEKNRHGETGKIRLAWRPQVGSVSTLVHPRQYHNPLDYISN